MLLGEREKFKLDKALDEVRAQLSHLEKVVVNVSI